MDRDRPASSRSAPARAFSLACAGLRAPAQRESDAGLAQRPGDDELSDVGAMLRGDRPISSAKAATLAAVGDREARIVLALVVALEHAVRADPAGQQPERQRRIAQDRDAVAQAERQRAPPRCRGATMLILLLDRVERAGGDIGLEIRGADIAGADRADLAGALQVLERVHGLRDRRRRVLPVGDVEVDMVGAEPPQALLQFVDDRLRGRDSDGPACRPGRRSGCPCPCARPARTWSPARPRRAARRSPCRRSPPTGPCHRRAPCRSATRRRRSRPGSPRSTRPRRCRPTSSRRWPRCRGRPRRRGCRIAPISRVCIHASFVTPSSARRSAVASSSTMRLDVPAAQRGADRPALSRDRRRRRC